MGLVPKVKGLFCTGYINKIGFCPGSGIGMEIASYKGRSQVRHRCLYLAGKNQEDDENAEKRRSFPQPGKRSCRPHGFRQPVPLLPKSWQRPGSTY